MYSLISILVVYTLLITVYALPTPTVAIAIKRAAPSGAGLQKNETSRASFVPLDPLGNVVPVYLPFQGALQTQLYYQDQQGNIHQHGVGGGPFTVGFDQGTNPIVQSGLSRRGTPLAVIGAIGRSFHVFYITPYNTLGETRYIGQGWDVGSSGACPLCIDNARILVSAGSQVLYAIQDPTDGNLLRVGFESVAAPGTISEAVSINFGRTWQIAPLPNPL